MPAFCAFCRSTHNFLDCGYTSEKLDFERFSRQSKNFFKMCGNPYKKVFCFIESWNWVSTIPTRREIDITVWQLLLKSFLFKCISKLFHDTKDIRKSCLQSSPVCGLFTVMCGDFEKFLQKLKNHCAGIFSLCWRDWLFQKNPCAEDFPLCWRDWFFQVKIPVLGGFGRPLALKKKTLF